eukprot:6034751-Prorocentrum_lima.AAC.1
MVSGKVLEQPRVQEAHQVRMLRLRRFAGRFGEATSGRSLMDSRVSSCSRSLACRNTPIYIF